MDNLNPIKTLEIQHGEPLDKLQASIKSLAPVVEKLIRQRDELLKAADEVSAQLVTMTHHETGTTMQIDPCILRDMAITLLRASANTKK